MLISSVQQIDSVIYKHKLFFCILFHYGLSKDIEYSSLCYTVGPCLSVMGLFLKACFFKDLTKDHHISLNKDGLSSPYNVLECSQYGLELVT